jgi:TrmH family RNA methyltransferase
MKRVESTSNPAIRHARRILKGREKKWILIEGKKLLEEAIRSQIQIGGIFATDEIYRKEERWLRTLETSSRPIHVVTSSLMKWITDVQTPSGIVAIGARPQYGKWMIPTRFAACLFSIRDPGNFGTIIRSAEASGCEFLFYTHDCADPFQPKVIRASAGSIFRLPVYPIRGHVSILEEIQQSKVIVYALRSDGEHSIFATKAELPALLLIGAETTGLPHDIPLAQNIRIPMTGRVESLNAAVAAAIAFYWLIDR